MTHRIGFLYNHDGLHQIAHTAPIVGELAGHADVSVLASSRGQEDVIRALLPEPARQAVKFVPLTLGPLARLLENFTGRFISFGKYAALRHNLDILSGFDALVVPETTTALLRTHFGLKRPKLIYLPHGAGDRSVGFQPVTKVFDFVLLSGPKVQERMLAEDLVRPGGFAVVGYPKFDTIDTTARRRFFDDDKPVVLYNPHFDPYLSSWYDMGQDVVRYFASQGEFNLIVAPHVMLAKRGLRVSIAHRKLRRFRRLPPALAAAPNIRVDYGSSNSIDMSYALSADIYLGDVSSQIYEWIVKPRPAIFLNSHGASWRDNPNYLHWTLGEVIAGAGELPAALARALLFGDAARRRQEAAFERNFSRTAEPSSRRAARAIIDFLARQNED